METFKSEFQFIMRRIFCLLPPCLAFTCVHDMLITLADEGYIEHSEFSSLFSLARAYFQILGGSDDER